MALTAAKRPQFYAHRDRDPNEPEGVRVVQFLYIAYRKGWPDMAMYRPLSKTFVYHKGGVDYCPLDEFQGKYIMITDSERIAKLEAIKQEIYGE